MVGLKNQNNMKKHYELSIRLRCPICGRDDCFEFNEDKSFGKCISCNKEFYRGKDELKDLNKGLIDEKIEDVKEEIKSDITKDIHKMMIRAFSGSRNVKIK